MHDVDIQHHHYLMYSEPIEYIGKHARFREIGGKDFPCGKQVMIDISQQCGNLSVPADMNAYAVRLNPPTMSVTIDGRKSEDVIGLVASFGLDWEGDYEETTVSITAYSPTNGLQSKGDIMCLFRN
jgi:hypothetical protein